MTDEHLTYGLGTTRHEMAMARHFLTKITDEGSLQIDCAIDSINKAVATLPDLCYIDELNEGQMAVLRIVIEMMADGNEASGILNVEAFQKFCKVWVAREQAVTQDMLVASIELLDLKEGDA